MEAESAEPEPDALEPAPEELEEVEAEVEEVPGPPKAALVKAGETGLARTDPLQAYMAEVQRHPLLTREEEMHWPGASATRGTCRRPTGWWRPTCAWW